MFWYDPKMCIFLSADREHWYHTTLVSHLTRLCPVTCPHVSARTILVLVTFSIVNLVFPPLPATLPMARERWSPRNIFTVCVREGRQ